MPRAVQNWSSVWDTEDPDLSACFDRTVLVWAPCGLLWLLAPLEARRLARSRDRLVPWTVLNVSRCVSDRRTLPRGHDVSHFSDTFLCSQFLKYYCLF